MLGEEAQVLTHLHRPGGTVETDHVDAHGLDGSERSIDLRARQHATGELDGDLGLDGDLSTG